MPLVGLTMVDDDGVHHCVVLIMILVVQDLCKSSSGSSEAGTEAEVEAINKKRTVVGTDARGHKLQLQCIEDTKNWIQEYHHLVKSGDNSPK